MERSGCVCGKGEVAVVGGYEKAKWKGRRRIEREEEGESRGAAGKVDAPALSVGVVKAAGKSGGVGR